MKTSDAPCSRCRTHGCVLVRGAARSQLLEFERAKTLHCFSRGQGIYCEGTPALAVHTVQTGRVKLSRKGPTGDALIVRIVLPGDSFGLRALFSNRPHTTTAEALEETFTCTLPGPVLLDQVRRSPQFALILLEYLALGFCGLEDMFVEIGQKRVRQRTACVLLGLLEESAPAADSAAGALRVARKDMASMIGTTRETLSRTLHEFAGRGIITLNRSELRVRDVSALRRLAGARTREM